jgi:hypothetical protein
MTKSGHSVAAENMKIFHEKGNFFDHITASSIDGVVA